MRVVVEGEEEAIKAANEPTMMIDSTTNGLDMTTIAGNNLTADDNTKVVVVVAAEATKASNEPTMIDTQSDEFRIRKSLFGT